MADTSQIKPLSKLQKRLLFIVQRRPSQLSTFDIINLNVRLGGDKEIEAALEGLIEAGLLIRDSKKKWQPTPRGAELVIPPDQLTR